MSGLSSLASQLRSVGFKHNYYLEGKRTETLIYTPVVAKTISNDEIYAQSLEGLEQISHVCADARAYRSTLFGESMFSTSRYALSSAEEQSLLALIKSYLLSISPYLRLLPAQKTIEYLIRQFGITESLCSEIIEYNLIHYDQEVFMKFISLIPHNKLKDTPWQWLMPFIRQKTLLTRTDIVKKMTETASLLSLIINKPLKDALAAGTNLVLISNLVQFVTSVLSAGLEAVASVNIELLSLTSHFTNMCLSFYQNTRQLDILHQKQKTNDMAPSFDAALISLCNEVFASALLVFGSIASTTTQSPDFWIPVVQRLSYLTDATTIKSVLQVICLIYQNQAMDAVPFDTLSLFEAQFDACIDFILSYKKIYDCENFIICFINTLCANLGKEIGISLLPKFLASLRLSTKQMGFLGMQLAEFMAARMGSDELVAARPVLERCFHQLSLAYPDAFDETLSFFYKRLDQHETKDHHHAFAFDLLSRSLLGTRHHLFVASDSTPALTQYATINYPHTQLHTALVHPNDDLRRQAFTALIKNANDLLVFSSPEVLDIPFYIDALSSGLKDSSHTIQGLSAAALAELNVSGRLHELSLSDNITESLFDAILKFITAVQPIMYRRVYLTNPNEPSKATSYVNSAFYLMFNYFFSEKCSNYTSFIQRAFPIILNALFIDDKNAQFVVGILNMIESCASSSHYLLNIKLASPPSDTIHSLLDIIKDDLKNKNHVLAYNKALVAHFAQKLSLDTVSPPVFERLVHTCLYGPHSYPLSANLQHAQLLCVSPVLVLILSELLSSSLIDNLKRDFAENLFFNQLGQTASKIAIRAVTAQKKTAALVPTKSSFDLSSMDSCTKLADSTLFNTASQFSCDLKVFVSFGGNSATSFDLNDHNYEATDAEYYSHASAGFFNTYHFCLLNHLLKLSSFCASNNNNNNINSVAITAEEKNRHNRALVQIFVTVLSTMGTQYAHAYISLLIHLLMEFNAPCFVELCVSAYFHLAERGLHQENAARTATANLFNLILAYTRLMLEDKKSLNNKIIYFLPCILVSLQDASEDLRSVALACLLQLLRLKKKLVASNFTGVSRPASKITKGGITEFVDLNSSLQTIYSFDQYTFAGIDLSAHFKIKALFSVLEGIPRHVASFISDATHLSSYLASATCMTSNPNGASVAKSLCTLITSFISFSISQNACFNVCYHLVAPLLGIRDINSACLDSLLKSLSSKIYNTTSAASPPPSKKTPGSLTANKYSIFGNVSALLPLATMPYPYSQSSLHEASRALSTLDMPAKKNLGFLQATLQRLTSVFNHVLEKYLSEGVADLKTCPTVSFYTLLLNDPLFGQYAILSDFSPFLFQSGIALDVQKKIFKQLIEITRNTFWANRLYLAARKVLESLSLSSDLFVDILTNTEYERVLIEHQVSIQSASHGKKLNRLERSASSHGPSDPSDVVISSTNTSLNTSGIILAETPTSSRVSISNSPSTFSAQITLHAQWSSAIRSLSLSLELLFEFLSKAPKSPIVSPHKLIPSLFSLLATSVKARQLGDFSLEHTKQLIIRCIYKICEGSDKSDEDVYDFIESRLDVELIVSSLRQSTNSQTQNVALSLLTLIAPSYPTRVLSSVMSIFTFMGSSMVKQDDDYTFALIESAIRMIIPLVIDNLPKEGFSEPSQPYFTTVGAVLHTISVFLNSFDHIPRHRRVPMFIILSKTLSNNAYLHEILSLFFAHLIRTAPFHSISSDEMNAKTMMLDSSHQGFLFAQALLESASSDFNEQTGVLSRLLAFVRAVPDNNASIFDSKSDTDAQNDDESMDTENNTGSALLAQTLSPSDAGLFTCFLFKNTVQLQKFKMFVLSFTKDFLCSPSFKNGLLKQTRTYEDLCDLQITTQEKLKQITEQSSSDLFVSNLVSMLTTLKAKLPKSLLSKKRQRKLPSVLFNLVSTQHALAQALDANFDTILKNILIFIGHQQALLKQNSVSTTAPRSPRYATFCKDSVDISYEILDAMLSVINRNAFTSFLYQLLGDTDVGVRKKALASLEAKLIGANNLQSEALFGKYLATFSQILDFIKQELVKPNGDYESETALVNTKQSALFAFDLMTKYLYHHSEFASQLEQAVIHTLAEPIINSDFLPLRSTATVCLLSTITRLKVKTVPLLGKIMPQLVKNFTDVIYLPVKSARDAYSNQHSGSKQHGILMSYNLACLRAITQEVPKFISSYLPDILAILLHPLMLNMGKATVSHAIAKTFENYPVYSLPQSAKNSLFEKAKHVLKNLSSFVDARVLLPVIYNRYKESLKKKDLTAGELLLSHTSLVGLIQATIKDMSMADHTVHYTQIFKFLLGLLDYTNVIPAVLKANVVDFYLTNTAQLLALEKEIVESMVALFFGLSEKSFKPLLLKLDSWHTSTSEMPLSVDASQRNLDAMLFNRQRVYLEVLNATTAAFKSVFLPFYSIVLPSICNYIESFVKEDSPFTKHALGRQMLESKDFSQLFSAICCLNRVFTYDTKKEYASILYVSVYPCLIKLLTYYYGLSSSEMKQEQEQDLYTLCTKTHIIPTIGHMMAAVGLVDHWRKINNALLELTRHRYPKVRFVALLAIEESYKKVGEDLCALVQESIPAISESLEDSSPMVENQAKNLTRVIESYYGESLDKFL